MESDAVTVKLPYLQTLFNIFKFTILPVALGMLVKHHFPKFTTNSKKNIARVSVWIIILALVLIYIKLEEIGSVVEFVKACFLSVLLLNIATLAVGYFTAKLSGLSTKQAITISIETGMQNNVLGMAIATSPALLNNPLMAVPAGVYGLLMYTSAVIMIFIFRKMVDDSD